MRQQPRRLGPRAVCVSSGLPGKQGLHQALEQGVQGLCPLRIEVAGRRFVHAGSPTHLELNRVYSCMRSAIPPCDKSSFEPSVEDVPVITLRCKHPFDLLSQARQTAHRIQGSNVHIGKLALEEPRQLSPDAVRIEELGVALGSDNALKLAGKQQVIGIPPICCALPNLPLGRRLILPVQPSPSQVPTCGMLMSRGLSPRISVGAKPAARPGLRDSRPCTGMSPVSG